jgi:hypothetical protein
MEKIEIRRNPIFYKKAYITLIKHYDNLRKSWKISHEKYIYLTNELTNQYNDLLLIAEKEKDNYSKSEWIIFEMIEYFKIFVSKLI